MEHNDLDSLFEIENDSTLWTISDTLAPYSRDLLTKYLDQSGKDIFEAKQLRLAISPADDEELLGLVDLFQFEPHHQRAGLGIIVKKSHQGKGIAKQAVELMTRYAFQFLGMCQLYAHVPSNNPGSKRLFENLGFTLSGTLRNWIKESNGFNDVLVYQLMNPDH